MSDWRNRCTLLHGDFAETLALCGGQADLVLTSPPYCDARTYGADVSWDLPDYQRLGDSVFAALRPGGRALINLDAPVREWRKGFGTERGFHPWRVMLDWAERVGFRVPDRLAFGRQGLPGEYRGRFRNDWEPLLWFVRPGGESWMDRRSIASAAVYVSSGTITERLGNGTLRSQVRAGWATDEGKRHAGTLWGYGSGGHSHTGAPDLEAENHPARWPYRLAEDIVRCFCPPDGLACDPFVGAGTSAVAALHHGRRFVGGDLLSRQDNEDNRRRGLDPAPWVDVAARVLDERWKQQRMFARGVV